MTYRQQEDPRLCDFGPPYDYVVGSKYDPKLDVAAIAKLVRAEIKDAVKAGTLPKLKTSVRIDRYSGGQSLDVSIMDWGVDVINEEYVRFWQLNGDNVYNPNRQLNQLGIKIQERLEGIREQYNYNRSYVQTDYFDVNFYGRVTWDWKQMRSKLEDKAAELERGQAPALASQDFDSGLAPTLSTT